MSSRRGRFDIASTTAKYIMVVAIALTLYDYLLMLDDEVKYMWKGRKTPVFYLYMLNRIILIATRLWEIYVASGPRDSEAGCTATYRAELLISLILMSSADVFITLRIYALTSRNKILAVYFGSLSLTRLVVSLVSYLQPVTFLLLPPIPLDIFKMCTFITHPRFKLVPVAIASVFELSAFIVVAWCAYRSMSTLKFSAVVRTIVAQGTVYFFAMFALQIYVQLSLILEEGISQQHSLAAYSLVNSVLSMRFALSLKRSGDSGTEWKSGQSYSGNFSGGPLIAQRAPIVFEGFEMGPPYSSKGLPQIPGY